MRLSTDKSGGAQPDQSGKSLGSHAGDAVNREMPSDKLARDVQSY